jgi:hypothetical protein
VMGVILIVLKYDFASYIGIKKNCIKIIQIIGLYCIDHRC